MLITISKLLILKQAACILTLLVKGMRLTADKTKFITNFYFRFRERSSLEFYLLILSSAAKISCNLLSITWLLSSYDLTIASSMAPQVLEICISRPFLKSFKKTKIRNTRNEKEGQGHFNYNLLECNNQLPFNRSVSLLRFAFMSSICCCTLLCNSSLEGKDFLAGE